ncbi:MAG: hypothetical protein IKR21_00825 [Oscillospiraceae bacterium]|nr:hypothetical protein [Oscillospiraceae bacterium]
MKISARFLCRAVVGEARDGEYQLPEGTDVAGFMAIAAEENGTFVKDYMGFTIFVCNGAPATGKTVLKDGDELKVLMRVYGG